MKKLDSRLIIGVDCGTVAAVGFRAEELANHGFSLFQQCQGGRFECRRRTQCPRAEKTVRGEAIELHCGDIGVRGRDAIFNITRGTHYHIEEGLVQVCAEKGNSRAAADSRRVLRGLLLTSVEGTVALVHAAAVLAADGRTILLVGGKGAGKSSFSVAMAAMGGRLISNDKCMIREDVRGRLVVFPLPYDAPLAADTAAALGLDQGGERLGDGKRLYSVESLARAVGNRRVRGGSIVDEVWVCQVQAGRMTMISQPLSCADQLRAVEQMNAYSHITTPSWLLKMWGRGLPQGLTENLLHGVLRLPWSHVSWAPLDVLNRGVVT